MASDKRYLNLTWTDPESGASRVRDYPLPLTIGRDTGNVVVLPAAGVSRQHCKIEQNGDEITVTDLNSSNGTYVNGEQISTSTLSEGDELAIGELKLTVSFSTTRRATSMDNLFDALTEGEAEATITLKSLKTKDLFADIDSPKITQPVGEDVDKIQTSELNQPPELSGDDLKEFLGGKLQKDIEKDISSDIDEVTSDMRRAHDTAMKKLQDKAQAQNAEPQGAINKLLASLRRMFGG